MQFKSSSTSSFSTSVLLLAFLSTILIGILTTIKVVRGGSIVTSFITTTANHNRNSHRRGQQNTFLSKSRIQTLFRQHTKHDNDDYPEDRIYLSPFLSKSKDDDINTTTTTALIILNQPICANSGSVFNRLWNMSSIRICADGGANRLFDLSLPEEETINNNDDDSKKLIPDLIVGDLDSLRDDVKEFYSKHNKCTIQKDPSQDNNDLDKALTALRNILQKKLKNGSTKEQQPSTLQICVYSAFGGRFDQTMASIQALFQHDGNSHSWNNHTTATISLYTEETSAMLLEPGILHKIYINSNIEGPHCGLIPIGQRCEFVKSNGLEWNLDNDSLEFGGIVSTSNRVLPLEDDNDEVVTVLCSHPLLWTIELQN